MIVYARDAHSTRIDGVDDDEMMVDELSTRIPSLRSPYVQLNLNYTHTGIRPCTGTRAHNGICEWKSVDRGFQICCVVAFDICYCCVEQKVTVTLLINYNSINRWPISCQLACACAMDIYYIIHYYETIDIGQCIVETFSLSINFNSIDVNQIITRPSAPHTIPHRHRPHEIKPSKTKTKKNIFLSRKTFLDANESCIRFVVTSSPKATSSNF